MQTGNELISRSLEQKKELWEKEQLQKFADSGKEPKNDSWKNKYKGVAQIDSTTHEVPEDWGWTSAEAICASVRDGTHDTPKYVEEGIPLITSKNLINGKLDYTKIQMISENDHEEISKRSGVGDGDILYAMIGTIGNPVVVKKISEFSIKNVGLFKKNEDFIKPNYLKYWLDSPQFNNWLKPRLKGTTQKFAPLGLLRSLPVPLAPPEQQKRIVTKIEELFSHIDAGIEALKKAKQLLKQYRQSVLKAAVTGELTKEWREVNKAKLEPASKLLETIEKKKLEVYEEEVNKWNELTKKWGKSDNKEKKPGKPKISKNIEPLSDEEIGELHSLPAGWLWVKLSQVATKITDGEHFKPPVQDDGVYFLSAKDVRDEGVSFENPLYISDETAAKALLRCNPESGDILIVSRGATVGRMCVVNTDEVFCLLGSVILIKGANGINSEYLMNLMKSPDVNRKISTVSGATAQQAIYLRDIQHVAIPLCSLEEQEEIDLAVNEKTEAIFRLEKEIYTKLAMAEKNKQSILASAFSGNIS